ncbi:MAG: SDR family oxidoreductase [Gammaproteobacteria bacterium]|nr:SDR family oxidoreductase [Gammaproteobacteria bacterium]
MARILIVGATSAIAIASARLFAARGDDLVLAARNEERLGSLAADLRVRGAGAVDTVSFMAQPQQDYQGFAGRVWDQGLDCLLLAHGSLRSQDRCQDDVTASRREFEVNALSTICLLAAFAGRFAEQGAGNMVVISSVAGDRGRQSNYLYGSAKAAVSTYCQGLRNRMHSSGVRVITIKPGFVDTPMTAGFEKGLLWTQPEQIASGILRALERGSDVVYLPWFWRYIMLVIRLIPERWFKRLSL